MRILAQEQIPSEILERNEIMQSMDGKLYMTIVERRWEDLKTERDMTYERRLIEFESRDEYDAYRELKNNIDEYSQLLVDVLYKNPTVTHEDVQKWIDHRTGEHWTYTMQMIDIGKKFVDNWVFDDPVNLHRAPVEHQEAMKRHKVRLYQLKRSFSHAARMNSWWMHMVYFVVGQTVTTIFGTSL